MAESKFPQTLDVFMTLVDGFHPVAVDDRDTINSVLRKIEDVLGAGISGTTGGTVYGPKGGNLDVGDRISTMIDPDGGLANIAFVTGQSAYSEFTTRTGGGAGKLVPFGKTLASTVYTVLFSIEVLEAETGGSGNWDFKAPCIWWVRDRFFDGCTIHARDMEGNQPLLADEKKVKWALLAIERAAYYVT